MDKLIIDRIVQAVLGPAAVAQLFDMREHTELGCPWCGDSIPPEDPVPTTVVIGTTEDRKFLVNFAHESCMPSQIYDLDANLPLEDLPPLSFTAYPILRYPPASPRAVILFELPGTFFDAGSGEDLRKLSFLRRGWEPVTDSFDRITAARLPGLSVRRRADAIVVDDDEKKVELIAFSNSVVPTIWWEVAAEEGASLIVYGSGLGLERFAGAACTTPFRRRHVSPRRLKSSLGPNSRPSIARKRPPRSIRATRTFPRSATGLIF